IYREVQRFEKTKAVTGQGPSYKYAPVEEIADALRVEMGKRGIVMVPSGAEVVASEDAGTTKSGTTRWRHIIRVTWTLTDGTDSLT
ncbi:ERF family protein, partial [Escherichia coli]|uniref:ERF family protein n=1 Tax=Escherichia coli TaxID=562 RepID=UPI000CB63E28